MGKQKISGFIYLIVGIIGAMMVCFFNLYLHTNQLDLLTKTPSTEIYDTYRFLCLLSIGIILCFSFSVLCISIRFQQKILVSILYILLGLVATGFIQYTFLNYYHINNAYMWTPANHALRIGILFILSLILFLAFEVPKIVNIITSIVNGVFLFITLIFVLFAKSFNASARTTWYGICEIYQLIFIILLIAVAVYFVKKDYAYSKHMLIALITFACYLPTQLLSSKFKPCYLSFYEVSFLVMFIIIGFTLLNYIITCYEEEKRQLALEQETDKKFVQRREHYEVFAEQLDSVKEIPEYTYSPILAVEALLLSYEKKAKINRIQFTVNLDIPKDVKIKHSELCLALSNLLDNAMEACEKMESGKKYIQVDANIVGHMLMLEVTNSYDGLPLIPYGDLYYTTKEYVTKGLGLTTTKDIATRYNGSLSIQAKADVPEPYFTAQIFFSQVAN